MALLRKQADLASGGFYILEEPSEISTRYLVGPLWVENDSKGTVFGQFKSFDLAEKQQIAPPSFVFNEGELKSFLVSESHATELLRLTLSEKEKKAYLEVFKELKIKMDEEALVKAVPFTKLEQDLESFVSLNAFLFQVLIGLKNKKSGYLFGFYNPAEKHALLGCSPEFIFKTNQSGEVSTTAVAGTQKKLKEENDLRWSDKLLKEHTLVMRGISERLKDQVIWGEVTEFTYGELSHLKAEGIVSKSVDTDELSKVLHPTPAIGSLPHHLFDQLNLGPEGRGHFGGYAEAFGYERPFSLVSIRCFEWRAHQVQVCIGGGILKESLAEQEWAELEDKWATFKSLWEI